MQGSLLLQLLILLVVANGTAVVAKKHPRHRGVRLGDVHLRGADWDLDGRSELWSRPLPWPAKRRVADQHDAAKRPSDCACRYIPFHFF
jgi:hypothetical protein